MTTKTKLDQQFVAELSERKGEPAWMRERRLAAWKQFETLPVPHYERTRLRDSHFQSFEPYVAVSEVDSFDELPEALKEVVGDPEGRTLVVQYNSEVVFRQIQELPEGVIVTDLDTAVKEHPDLVEKHFMNRDFPGGDNKIVALNGALHSGGLFVYVPEDVRVRTAVEFIVWMDEVGAAVLDHSLIVAEPRSRVRVIETAAGVEDGKAYRFGVQEVFSGEGARVLCGNVQLFGPKVQNLVVRRTVPGERSSTDWISAEFGADMSVNEIDNRVDGLGSEVRGLGVFFASDRQHLDLEMKMIHTARESGSDILVRGVTRDNARAVYGPYTRLRHDAKDSTGFQRGNTLVLDRSARAYSIPQLHVEEDEVQGAGHAATVGNVDELQLFYLMSRGLTEREAKKLIVDGFFFPVLEHIPIKAVRERVIELIERKMAT